MINTPVTMEEDFYDPLYSEEQNPKKRFKTQETTKKNQDVLSFIVTPLSSRFKQYISSLVEKTDSDEAISIIEEVAESNVGPQLFDSLIDKLQAVIQEKDELTSFVKKILFFESRPCKSGINCENFTKNCVFSHDICKEVVLNHVKSSTAEEIKNYCATFGPVKKIKRMNLQKHLVVYEKAEDALNLIKSRDPVLNDPKIKKFFNKKTSNFNSLIAEQEALIQSVNDPKIATKLKINLKKFKDLISEIKNQ